MTLHLPTLLSTLTLTSSVLAMAVLTVAWRAHIHRGLSLWGAGLVVNALSYPAFALRVLDWPAFSILSTNLLTTLTLALHIQALMVFQRSRAQTLPGWLVWLPVPTSVVLAGAFLHDDHWRNILVAALQSAMALMLVTQAWAPRLQGPRLTGRLVMIAGAALLAGMFLTRTAFMVAESDWDQHYNVPDQIQAVTYFVTMAVLLLNSMGFVLMQMEHAIASQHELANHDALTGTFNRRALMVALERDIAQACRDKTPLTLLMIDIDHFKLVNDQHGHLVGDEVLRQVAQRTQLRLRRSDLLARYGGEEFLALLPNTDQPGALVVAEAIRRSVAELPITVGKTQIPVTVSIGVHSHPQTPAPAASQTLIAASDEALYRAKHNGRNRVEVT